MSNFTYVAKDKEGKTLKGTLEAPSNDEAVGSLRSKGLVIISLQEARPGAFSSATFFSKKTKKIKIDDLVVFSRQLATMVDAGIPLVNALDILAEQLDNPSFKAVAIKIHKDVETGASLSEALSKHKKVFSTLFINMVRAGETSGMLDDILDRLATYLEKTSALQKKMKSALIYPAVVTFMALGITIFLLITVIPVFKDMYAGFDARLPLPTEIIIGISDFMRKNFFLGVALIAVLSFLVSRYIKTEKGKLKIDSLKLNLPVFGILIKKMAVGKFTRTLSTLIKSGVPILDSLEIVSKTADNRVVEMAVDSVRRNVKEGEPIADPLARSGVFPPMVVRMIGVGEADFYDEQVDAAVSGLTSLIEPLIIAFLGIVIGGIVVCMFLPILKMSSVLAG